MKFEKNYFQLKGKNAEDAINQLAYKSFLKEWCYPNPKDKTGKEICDLLVVFDDIVIIIQIKDIKFNGNDERYIKKAFEHPMKQIFGAERNLFSLSENLELENPNGDIITFNKSEITNIYRLVFSIGSGDVPYNIIQEQKGKLIHTFDSTIESILNELDTISDFCKYLKDKEDLIISNPKLQIIASRELDILCEYIKDKKTFDHLENVNLKNYDDGIWEKFIYSNVYKAKKEADKISYFCDDLIELTSTCPEKEDREIARELSKLDRFSRRIFSDFFISAHEQAEKRNVTYRRYFENEGTTYCFLFTPKDFERINRKDLLHGSCYVTRNEYRNNFLVIGIATEIGSLIPHSYDFLYLYFEEWEEENIQEAKRIQDKFNIHESPKETLSTIDEYPISDETIQVKREVSGVKTFKRKYKKIGRNEKCPCGSNLKYKNCCIID